MNVGRYFEDFIIGEEVVTAGRTITETDIVNFAAFTGDWYELHSNREFAARTQFGQRIAHGALVFAVATGLAMRMTPPSDTLLAFYGLDKLRFVKPVFINDTICLRQQVADLRVRDAQSGLVIFHSEVINQQNQVVVSYTAQALYRRQPEAGGK